MRLLAFVRADLLVPTHVLLHSLLSIFGISAAILWSQTRFTLTACTSISKPRVAVSTIAHQKKIGKSGKRLSTVGDGGCILILMPTGKRLV